MFQPNVDWRWRVSGAMFAHAVHLCVLLTPTLLLVGPWRIGWATGCFAAGITVAGVLESLFLSPDVEVRNAPIRDRVAMRVSLFVGIFLLAVFWSAQIEWFFHGRSAIAIHGTGGLFLVVGIVLRIEAIRALGPQFVSDVQISRLVIRNGIYAWLRHPSEIGLLLIAIGGPLLIGAPWTAMAAAFVLVPTSLWRMNREEIALAA